jgi:hypothetical protein
MDIGWNFQKLAAEQHLPEQAQQNALPSFHHGTDHGPLAKQGTKTVRTSSLAFGYIGSNRDPPRPYPPFS